jgi:hypothetical protein
MSYRRGALLFLLFAALFLISNYGAYRGYFQDDEIDNLSWTPFLTTLDFLQGLVTPLYQPHNFRPAGHYYFHAVEAVAGLNYPVYVAVIHGLHLLNVWLLWLIVRRLGAGPLAAAGACLFFGVNMALFDNFWKPMYVFDVLCGTFSLVSIWCWARGRWILSFLAFWLAYKSKELAVMLPVALACYELWFGKRRWKYLLPFFAVSLSFGLQGILRSPGTGNDYSFHFTFDSLAHTAPFYAGRFFLLPYLGFAIPLLFIVARNRRLWFGLAAMSLFLFPLLFLPGRVFSAYCYLPLAGLAIALTGLPPAAVMTFAILMLPMDLRVLRRNSRETLGRDHQVRIWMDAVQRYAAQNPDSRTFVFIGAPQGFERWGVEGTLKYYYKRGDLIIREVNDPDAGGLRAVRLMWDYGNQRLSIIDPS